MRDELGTVWYMIIKNKKKNIKKIILPQNSRHLLKKYEKHKVIFTLKNKVQRKN